MLFHKTPASLTFTDSNVSKDRAHNQKKRQNSPLISMYENYFVLMLRSSEESRRSLQQSPSPTLTCAAHPGEMVNHTDIAQNRVNIRRSLGTSTGLCPLWPLLPLLLLLGFSPLSLLVQRAAAANSELSHCNIASTGMW